MKSLKNCQRVAFTLAEVLITLTIIGVIAALTIPNLMKKYENHVHLTQLKNWYSEFSNAIGEFKAQNGNVWEVYDASLATWNGLFNAPFIKFLDEKYGDSYNNRTSSYGELWKNKNGVVQYKNLAGIFNSGYPYPSLYNGASTSMKTYRCKNGAMFAIQYEKDPTGAKAWVVIVDVNGPKKGPNIVGRDTFHFYIDDNSAKLYGRYTSWSGYFMQGAVDVEGGCNPTSTSYSNGITCARKIMQEGWQMNY